MKIYSLFLALFSTQLFAGDISLICDDQNSHSIYRLQISENLEMTKLINLIGDSSVLSAGSRNLKRLEGESSPQSSTYSGKLNNGLSIALIFNSEKASTMASIDTLNVNAYFQQQRGDILSKNTLLLCSKESF